MKIAFPKGPCSHSRIYNKSSFIIYHCKTALRELNQHTLKLTNVKIISHLLINDTVTSLALISIHWDLPMVPEGQM